MAATFAEAAGEAYSHRLVAFSSLAATAFSTGDVKPDTSDSKTWAKGILITGSSGAIRFTYDGTTPTSALGHALTNGDAMRIEGPINIQNFKAIAIAGGVAQIQATYERDMK